ncbi:MAG: sigma-70 family RNA polymerase sigma factor [Desulfobacteraceae bacterium]|nr:MAG: sigma-70 family RNA polymerase sigma factor [Desulfobacteraceae bacterium]
MQARETVPDSSNLIKRACGGDEAAFGELVHFYQQRLIGYCHRMTGSGAEDLAQEIFIKFYLALDRFDLSRPIDPFLFRIAHNHCLDALKKKTVPTIPLIKKEEGEKEIQIEDNKPNAEDLMQKNEVQKAVNQALASVPVLYRSALIMYHVEDLSYEEISGALDLPLGTVKARIHRGRELLQQKLQPFVFLNEGI